MGCRESTKERQMKLQQYLDFIEEYWRLFPKPKPRKKIDKMENMLL